jgi:hypothetical protein
MCVLRREEGGSADLVGTSEKHGRKKERKKTREVEWCRGRRGGGIFFGSVERGEGELGKGY